jgi:hypothetical protein
MLLANYNVLEVHDSLSKRRWDISDNPSAFIINFLTGYVPALQFIVDDASTASFELLDENDNVVSGSETNFTIESASGYKRLIHLHEQLTGKDEGYYSFKITIDSDVYYSDMFCWRDDLSGFLKVKAYDLGDFYLGEADYRLNMENFVYECYVSAEYQRMELNLPEEGEEVVGVTKTTYGSRTLTRVFQLDFHEYLFVFMSGLRILSANGMVQFSWDNKDYNAHDITVDIEDDPVEGDIYIILLKFKVMGETLSVCNAL